MRVCEGKQLGCDWEEEMVDLVEPSDCWAWEPEAAFRMRRLAWVVVALPCSARRLAWP